MKKPALYILILLMLAGCGKPPVAIRKSENPDFKKAEALFNQPKNDSAFYYLDKAASGSKDSLEIAMAYNYMASIQSDAGDYFGAQESLTTSLRYLNEHKKQDRYCLASDYNELGTTSSRLQNNINAITYLDSALHFCDDRDYRLIFTNNKANAYRRNGDYTEALALYRQVLQKTKKGGKEYPRILSNLAYTKWLKDPAYPAAAELHESLRIRQSMADNWGANASYGHLSDYYYKSKPDSALFYARSMYINANKLHSPDDQVSALEKLIRLSDGQKAKVYFSRYAALNDSLQTARNAAKNQFALIRYHTEKSKADNLRLQHENSEKQYQILKQQFGLALSGIFVLGLVIWFRKRRQRLQQQADERIRQDRLEVSQKVHDVVANGIYRVMTQVDYSDQIDKNYLLGQLDEMYEQSRKISHDDNVAQQTEAFSEKIQALANAFKNDHIKLALSGNEPELWESVPAQIKSELELIIQELIVNMNKHSQATIALLDFERNADKLFINYRDNGIGFPADIIKGKGLRNTENRIGTLSGQLNFGSGAETGARLQITIPLT